MLTSEGMLSEMHCVVESSFCEHVFPLNFKIVDMSSLVFEVTGDLFKCHSLLSKNEVRLCFYALPLGMRCIFGLRFCLSNLGFQFMYSLP